MPFHVVNLLLHAAATLLLAQLFLRLGHPAARRGRGGASFRRPSDSRRGGDEHRRAGRDARRHARPRLSARRAPVSPTERRRGRLSRRPLLLYGTAILVKESAAVAPALLFLLLGWSASRRPRREASGGVLAGARVLRRRGSRARSRFLGACGGARRRAQVGTDRHLRARESAGAASAARARRERLRDLPADARTARASAPALLGRIGLVDPAADPREPARVGRAGAARGHRDRVDPEAPRAVDPGARVPVPGRGGAAELEPALSDGNDLRREARVPAVGGLLPDRGLLDRRRRIRQRGAHGAPDPAGRSAASPAAGSRCSPRRPFCSRCGRSFATPSGRATRPSSPTCSGSRRGAPRRTTTTPTCRPRSARHAAPSRTTRGRRRSTRATGTRGRDGAAWSGSSGTRRPPLQAYAEALRIFPGYENGYFGVGLAREALGDFPAPSAPTARVCATTRARCRWRIVSRGFSRPTGVRPRSSPGGAPSPIEPRVGGGSRGPARLGAQCTRSPGVGGGGASVAFARLAGRSLWRRCAARAAMRGWRRW